MKIGLVVYGSLDRISGGYLYDRKLVQSLEARGDQVRIVSLPERTYAAHLVDNFHFRLPGGFEIIIQDELNHPSLLAANARKHACPVVSLVHNLHSLEPRPAWQNSLSRLVERRYLETVDAFIFNSNTSRRAVQGLIGSGRPFVVANPPTDRFGAPLDAAQIRRRAHEPGPLRLLFLGNVTPLKGLHVLLEAVRGQPCDLRLDVVGSLGVAPAYARRMREQAAVGGLTSRVSFHGVLDGDALKERLCCAQVMVVPSAYEGFGIAYLEGMGFGLPAIGTTAGAARELIAEDQNGYLIPPEDARVLAARLAGLAADRSRLEKMSLEALRRYQEQPPWERTVDRIRAFLAQSAAGGA